MLQLEFNYLSMVPHVSPLLNDLKAKIRLVAMETLAVVALLTSPNDTLAHPSLDKLMITRLRARLSDPRTVKLTEDWIELPRAAPGSAPSVNLTSTLQLQRRVSSNYTSAKNTTGFPVIMKNASQSIRHGKYSSMSFSRLHNARPEGAKRTLIVKTEVLYIKNADLKPLEHPERDIEGICSVETNNWTEQFEVINMLRSLVKHHKEVFLPSELQRIILKLLEWAGSLRSALSKNGIILLGEMCRGLKKFVEPELDQIVPVLLKKAADTNIFISEEGGVAMQSMCVSCNENKVSSVLIAFRKTVQSSAVKAKISLCFQIVNAT